MPAERGGDKKKKQGKKLIVDESICSILLIKHMKLESKELVGWGKRGFGGKIARSCSTRTSRVSFQTVCMITRGNNVMPRDLMADQFFCFRVQESS